MSEALIIIILAAVAASVGIAGLGAYTTPKEGSFGHAIACLWSIAISTAILAGIATMGAVE